MANVQSMKRQLLRELVQENVDLIEGRLPRRLRKRGRLPAAVRLGLAVLLCGGLIGLSSMLPAGASRQAAVSPIPGAPLPAALSPETQAAAVSLEGAPAVAAAALPLAVRRVVIDPGHGGDSLGTHTPGLVEKEITLDIAARLRRLLANDHFEVVMTRQGDRAVELRDRTRLANQSGGDIFVSIHVNWISNRDARGIETYYLGATNDPYLTKLAAAENRDSGYSVADTRTILDRIYAGVRQDKSRALAEKMQESLYHSLRKLNPELEDRGVKAAPFIVLLTTDMPAILAEVSCLSNEEEARLLSKPLYRQYIAEALAQGVRSYADAAAGAGEKGI
ncbi:MAG TPA: N-acetylmuramoyl-L-alanine amidase [Thermoanaerobaculia bacterium]|jgi:N-acetylmuramoyl-L-alanine amidase|nr:N-acetylmuramoyl-L-alanine amidase [Thermoanaerobaculia bacterium]